MARRVVMRCPSAAHAGGPTRVLPPARRQLRRDDADAEELREEPEAQAAEEVPLGFDAERIVARTRGREGWLRECKRQLEASAGATPI